jgi:hypothetical protein
MALRPLGIEVRNDVIPKVLSQNGTFLMLSTAPTLKSNSKLWESNSKLWEQSAKLWECDSKPWESTLKSHPITITSNIGAPSPTGSGRFSDVFSQAIPPPKPLKK